MCLDVGAACENEDENLSQFCVNFEFQFYSVTVEFEVFDC